MAYKRKSPFNEEGNAYTDPGTIKTSMPEFSGAPILDIKADGPSKINKEKPHQVTDEELKNDDTMAQNLIDDESTDGGSPMAYLNPNTMEVQGDAGQMDQPNRAGRPVNSNVLMNDPMSYQDPSKMSAQQNQQEQIFSGLASSMGQANPEPMIPGQAPNQSITPGQPAPFNMNGGPTDPPQKKGQKIVGTKPNYSLSQKINKTTGDTTSYEMIPGPKKWVDDDTFGRVQMSTLKSNPISNEEYSERMNATKSPLKKKDKVTVTRASRKSRKEAGDSGWVSMADHDTKQVSDKRATRMEKRGWKAHRKPKAPDSVDIGGTTYTVSGNSPFNKSGWIQDVNKDIERRGTKGVCTGDKFGSESCPPGSKRYNLAKTFKKMNKK